MEAVVDPGAVILDRIASLEVERAKIEARIAAEMLDFVDLRRREAIRASIRARSTSRTAIPSRITEPGSTTVCIPQI